MRTLCDYNYVDEYYYPNLGGMIGMLLSEHFFDGSIVSEQAGARAVASSQKATATIYR